MIPILDQLKELKEGEETVLWVHGHPFVVTRATGDDIERISKGFVVID